MIQRPPVLTLSRRLPVLSAALCAAMVVTLGPVTPAAHAQRPEQETARASATTRTHETSTHEEKASRRSGNGGGLTDITDGLPVAGITRDAAPNQGADVPTTLLADAGLDSEVRKAAEDGPVDVIVRLRTQVATDELGEQAAAAGIEAALDRRTSLADSDLGARAVSRRVDEASETARTGTVVEGLKQVANEGRESIAPSLSELRSDGHVTGVRRFWIFNGFAATVDRAGLEELAALPQVASITEDEQVQLPDPEPTSAPKLPTWGVERVRATDVWGRFGNRGSGVVLGLMDSGVDLGHPALTDRWRGASGDPAKSWFVATGEDYATPDDGFGHGTHVAGTMVGGPPGEVVGVAPKATWIAAKIFNDGGGASTSGIHAGFQWMLAPGGDPAARPDVVNNSWGASAPNHPEYRPDVQAWVAAGIVPIFSNGNDGPASGTVGSPGSFPESFGVGASDVNDVIASFSSRGPVTWDGTELTKPDITAPGHHVISAFPADLGWGEYVDLSGTSMAAPHVTGVAGLVLAGNPSLTVDQVESALTATARQEPHMGELPDNDYGHGIVDALAAVNASGESGTVSGTVTTKKQKPVPGASLVVEGSPWTATTATEQGAFQLVVPTGTHTIRVSAPGQLTTEITVTMTKGGSLLRNISMKPAGSYALSGTVRSGGTAIADAEVSVAGVGTDFTDGSGRFQLTVPGGTHEVVVRATGHVVWSQTVTVTNRQSLSVSLQPLSTAAASGWTEYQNTPAHTGRTDAAVAPKSLRRLWSVDTGPGITFSSPVIADGRVFVGTTDGQLEARDLETGEQLWVYDVGDQLRGSPAVADGTVVIGGGIDGGLVALDAETGEVTWQVATPGQLTVYTQPTVIDGVVYANTGPSAVDDSVYAVDLASGEVLWSTPVAVGVFNGAASDGERLYITSADEAAVIALDRATGEVEWTVTRAGESFYSAASVADGIVYATTTNDAGIDGTLLALDSTDGAVVWQRPDHGDAQGSSPAVYGDLVITGTHANGAVVAYDRASGDVAWRYQDSGPVSASLMTTADGYVIGGTQLDSVVFALDAATGRRVFLDDVGANVTTSGAYDEGTYVTADTSGQLYAYRTTGTVKGSLSGPDGPLDGRVEVVATGDGGDTDAATGAYSFDHRPGEFELRASAYGFVAQTRTVTVLGGRTVTEDFTLQPAGTGAVSGTVTGADGAGLGGAEVTLVGTPLAPVTTDANGAFAFSDVAAGEYRVRVTLDGYADHTGTVTVAAGETAILDVALDRYRVAVMGDYEGIMVDTLDRLGYQADVTTYAEVTADPERYELVIANGAEDRPADGVIQPFIDATDEAGTSVIWLDQWSIGYGSILNLSQQTGDPAEVVTEYQGSGRVSVVARHDHPLTTGLTLGTRVPVLANDSEWSAFKGYSGISVADLHVDTGGEVGSAVAYKPRSLDSTHVLLSTFAAAPWGRPEVEWLPIVEDVIGNATAYALDVEYSEVTGTVTDESGAPVEGATVVVPGTGYHTSTAADGGFELLVDPGDVTMRFRAPGFAANERTLTLEAGGSTTVDVVLTAAADGTVAGTVTDDGSGTPVAGATVRIAEIAGAETTTAADGSYTLSGIPAEDYLLEVTADGYLGAEREVTVQGDATTTVDVALTAAPRVGVLGDYDSELATLLQGAGMNTRTVGWSDTAALADLDVVVVNDPPTPTAAAFNGFLAAMDEHRVSGVFGDGYFSSDGGVRFLRQFTGNPSQDRVQVTDQGDIRYRAIDPDHPLFAGLGDEPQVLVHDSYATAIPGYTGFPLAELVSETGGEHGVAATYQPRTADSIHVLLGGLTAGILLEADEDWTQEGRRLFANAVLFAAQPDLGTVSGDVIGAEGRPVAGTVSVEGTEQRVNSADDGSYALHLPPGTWTLRYAGFGYAAQTAEVTIADGEQVSNDVALVPSETVGSISGSVTNDGAPVAGATVRLLGVPRSVTTGADGSYELPLVEPGEYQLDITTAGYLRERIPVMVGNGGAVQKDVPVRVTARVGVIDDYQGKVAAWLQHWGYTPQAIDWDDTAAVADLDLVVANLASFSGVDPGRDGLRAFDDAVLRAGISVVWLDQFGRGSFRYLTEYGGDPAGNGEDRTDGPVTATISATDHPIAEGLPDQFPVVAGNNEFSWFEDFGGTTLATVAGDTSSGGLVGERPRGAAGIDLLVGTLSMSTYGFASYDDVVGDAWSPEAERLLRNSVRYALDAPPSGGQVEGVLSGPAGPLEGTVTVVETGRVVHVAGDGEYVIGLPPGTWTLRGSAAHHIDEEVTVEVAVGERVTRDLTLTALDTGTVTGTVTDAEGAGMPGAEVSIAGTEFATTTDAGGAYTLEGIPVGDHRLVVKADGWETARRNVTVTAGEVTTVDVQLEMAAEVALVGDSAGSVRALLERDGFVVTDHGTTATALDALADTVAEYDVVILNRGATSSALPAFGRVVDNAAAEHVSVIFASQWGGDAIASLRAHRGDPQAVVGDFVPTPVAYVPAADHPIFDGFTPGEPITILDDPEQSGDNQQYSVFDGYSGMVLAGVHGQGQDLGSGVGLRYSSNESVEVLLASMAAGSYGQPGRDWTPEAEQIYLQAVAFAATAQRGSVRGTVTSGGTPVAGAEVTVGGEAQPPVTVTTGEDGQYDVGAVDGSYTVEVAATGYTGQSREVTVVDHGTVTADFDLAPLPRGELTGLVSDEDGPVAGATVTGTGAEEWSATTGADGRFRVTGVLDGPYDVQVTAPRHLPAAVTLDYVGPSMTLDVPMERIDVGVVGDADGALVDFLREEGVAAGPLDWATDLDLTGYDVVVVNGDGGDQVTTAEFDRLEAEARRSGTGVVWTGTWGDEGGLRVLADHDDRVTLGADGYGDGVVRLTDLKRRRRLFEGLGDPATILSAGSWWNTIESYDGQRLATQRVALESGGTATGIGAAWDWTSKRDVEVLLASLAATGTTGPDLGWTGAGERLFLNAVELARDPR